jgi:hypothetical protein
LYPHIDAEMERIRDERDRARRAKSIRKGIETRRKRREQRGAEHR